MPVDNTIRSIPGESLSRRQELERRCWTDARQTVRRIEGELAAIVAAWPPPLGEPERQQLMWLGVISNGPGRTRLHQPQRASASCAPC